MGEAPRKRPVGKSPGGGLPDKTRQAARALREAREARKSGIAPPVNAAPPPKPVADAASSARRQVGKGTAARSKSARSNTATSKTSKRSASAVGKRGATGEKKGGERRTTARRSAASLPAAKAGKTLPKKKPRASSRPAGATGKHDVASPAAPEATSATKKVGRVSGRRAPGKSSRFSASGRNKSARASTRTTGAAGEPVAGEGRESRLSRRSTRVVAPFWTKKRIGAAGGAAVLLLIIAVGYEPFMKSRLVAELDGGSPEAKRAAALELYHRWGGEVLPLFEERLRNGGEESTWRAAAAGLGAALKTKHKKVLAARMKRAAELLADGSDEVKLILLKEALAGASAEVLAPPLLKIVRAAGEPDAPLRLAALKALCHIPAEGVCTELLQAAADKSLKIRAEVLKGVADTARPDAVEVLLTAISSADEELARAAREGFKKVREKAPAEKLRALLSNPKPAVRRAALEALVERPNDAVAAAGVVRELADPVPALRAKAAAAVVRLRLTEAQLNRAAALGLDESAAVRKAATKALAARSDGVSYAALKKAAAKRPPENPPLELLAALSERSVKRRRRDYEVIDLAMKALGAAEKVGAATKTAAVCRALAGMTAGAGGSRRAERRESWTTAKWKSWYAKVKAREEKYRQALALDKKALEMMTKRERLDEAKAKKWLERLGNASDSLAAFSDECRLGEPEDAARYENLARSLNEKRMHVMKNWHR